MFEQLQGSRWYLTRPQNNGLLAVVLAFLFCSAAPWVFRMVNKNHVSSKNQDPPQRQKEPVKSQRPSAVEIMPPPQIVPRAAAKPKPVPAKCRCHIDTQAEGQGMVHHNSHFAMCNSMDKGDEAWREGFYFRTKVKIRWHCVTQ